MDNRIIFRILSELHVLFPNARIQRHVGTHSNEGLMFVSEFVTCTDFTIIAPFGVAISGIQRIGERFTVMLYVLDAEAFCNHYKLNIDWHENIH